MSNQITALAISSINDIQQISKLFYDSGMFSDAKSAAQIAVKVMAGHEIGIQPFAAINGIHIIQGKPVLGAGLIASVIKRSGKYNYRVIETTEKICSIDFFEDGQPCGNSTFTIEQAKKMGVKNIDKFPQNMLFARAISNGAKWFTPDVFGGPVYTEGEIEPAPTVQDTTHTVVQEAIPAPAPPVDVRTELMKEIQGVTTAEEANGLMAKMRKTKMGPDLGRELGLALVSQASDHGIVMVGTGKKDSKGKELMEFRDAQYAEEVPQEEVA